MRTRLLAAAMLSAMVLGSGAAMADHPFSGQPSNHCGAPPSTQEVKVKGDTKRPGVCFAPTGGFKGAAIVDTKTKSVYYDGDSTNQTGTNRCADGYIGIHAGGTTPPHFVYTPGGNYDPDAAAGDGGANGDAAGHPHDDLSPEEYAEIMSCLGDF